jgi:hypothetical protein
LQSRLVDLENLAADVGVAAAAGVAEDTAKSKNSIMLSHNNIYQDLQTIDNHVELIILRR